MATMNVSLTSQMLDFVNTLVKSGGYASASEVVRDGLRLLEREKAAEVEKLELLKRAVEAGLADAETDRFSSRTAADIAHDVIRTSGRAS